MDKKSYAIKINRNDGKVVSFEPETFYTINARLLNIKDGIECTKLCYKGTISSFEDVGNYFDEEIAGCVDMISELETKIKNLEQSKIDVLTHLG